MGDTVTLPNSSRPAPLAKKRPRLYLLFTPQAGVIAARAFSLPVGDAYLGRKLSPDHDGFAWEGDSALSAEHVLAHVTDGDFQVSLRDLGSKNGSWVGRTRLHPKGDTVVLRDGQVVRLGGSLLLLRYEPAKSVDGDIKALLGGSLTARELRARLVRLAPESVPVLLQGETGSGKEVAARALHEKSGRPGELVARNCAAIPANLIESELFGHAANAFTSAKPRTGAFRSADRGTLFLDEIGELAIDLQARLLRVVEEGQVTPLGTDKPVPCQVRLVAATNRDLQGAVAAGTFRADLYARLAHMVVELPPLRARREDVLLLLRHFYPEVSSKLHSELVQDLLLSDWRHNVRGLRAVADRLRIDGDTEELRRDLRGPQPARVEIADEAEEPDPVTPRSQPGTPQTMRPYRLPIPSRERLTALLSRHLGTVQHIADELGCSRRQAQRWLEHYNLNADEFRHSLS